MLWLCLFVFCFRATFLSLSFKICFISGNSNSDTPLLSAHCGTMATTEYTSTGRYVLVTFTSDSSLTDVGFQMTYLSAADSCRYQLLHSYCNNTFIIIVL